MSALELYNPPIPSTSGLGRFRVVDRAPRPNVRRTRRPVSHPFRTALLCTAAPAMALVFYVSLWTASVHGGNQELRVSREIYRLKNDNEALQIRVWQLQESTRIRHRATELGMRQSPQIEYVMLPTTK